MSESAEPRRFLCELRVRFAETDAAGIVFYPNFFVWFDVATHEVMRACGHPMTLAREADGFGLPMVECGAHFYQALLQDDLIAIESRVTRLTDKAMRVDHRVLRDGELMAEGFEVRVNVRRRAGRLKSFPFPEDLRAALLGAAATSNQGEA